MRSSRRSPASTARCSCPANVIGRTGAHRGATRRPRVATSNRRDALRLRTRGFSRSYDPAMHLQAHAALGWMIGAAVPGADRRLRAWCTVAAVLPDIDGLTYAFGPLFYSHWHHTFGHNVFLGFAAVAIAALHHRRRVVAALLVAI